ncbi:hypothetical protein PZ897_10465 [Hoeflea sp. YIM 152468]|uniref:hypothetical protein n=1 Tax=Hoeflea sp. YIM 152468 TaxID=3031759 RepID=UPI0023D9D5E8|nr:hypothetical protein [Hoeflea sp. YIM 152468]MDF1608599.1 hypothetical protein [Hoeflea sp. YIM 152468]
MSYRVSSSRIGHFRRGRLEARAFSFGERTLAPLSGEAFHPDTKGLPCNLRLFSYFADRNGWQFAFKPYLFGIDRGILLKR